MTRVTIRHVAEHAGVSTSTVSRTLHNHPRISEETKRRVIEALKALGLILPTSAEDLLMHPFFTQVMRGISTFAQARQHNPGLSSVEIHPDRLGQAAARLLIERIEFGRASENHVIAPTRFVARAITRQSPV
ncbi:MAG: LacI family DNA-binding transcriptional regulator [Spirochaetaceae bacterium]|nr:LacI family DNA-binding transcriptional regulator [Spirochaetaceae bacterium]